MVYYIILLLIIIILYFLSLNKKMIEGYDARFDDMDIITCANFCKTNSNCFGFAYDKANNICYPSETTVGDYPTDSIFKNEYSENNTSCNKFKVIVDPDDTPAFVDRRMNAIYMCKEDINKHPKYYYQNLGKMIDIGNGKMIDHIIDVEDYKVLPYSWPKDQFDYNQTDLLLKTLSAQNILPSNTTNMEEILNYKPPLFVHYVDPEEPSSQNITFMASSDYNTGSYLMDYKCLKDIDKDVCTKSCATNINCNGFEFNTNYNGNNNVCCLYHTVGDYVKRDSDKANGKFYQKIVN